MTGKRVRIGGASGFWGDSGIAIPQLIEGGQLDYLVFDYLAEITMSIMARARAKNPDGGYAGDFVTALEPHLPSLADRRIRVISNAGGVNPIAAAEAMRAAIRRAELNLTVATVTGDDVRDQITSKRSEPLVDMFSQAPLPADLLSANAYLGAFPVAAALARGADIVITGRCVDSAVALGACIHEFEWAPDDYDRLAGGSLAGHIIECGAQATGGIHTDWERTGDWANIGYPVACVAEDGSFEIEKPADTGGLVSFATVAEQLVYEIGDPRSYLLPDVTCDFSEVIIEEIGGDRVRVERARGRAPSDSYKVSATYVDGFRVGLYLTIIGIDAAAKAARVGDAIVRRCSAILADRGQPPYSALSVEVIGSEAAYGPHASVRGNREVILKIAAKHVAREPLQLLVREATSSGTSMAPGITSMGGNRPTVSPLVRLFSCLLAKSEVKQRIEIDGLHIDIGLPEQFREFTQEQPVASEISAVDLSEYAGATKVVRLIELAWARSGDKGNNVNIGVIARRPEYLPWIRKALTANAVAQHFSYNMSGATTRYDLPGIGGLNFVLEDALDGGGIASLRNDPQGKGHAQMLLDFPVSVPASLEVIRQ